VYCLSVLQNHDAQVFVHLRDLDPETDSSVGLNLLPKRFPDRLFTPSALKIRSLAHDLLIKIASRSHRDKPHEARTPLPLPSALGPQWGQQTNGTSNVSAMAWGSRAARCAGSCPAVRPGFGGLGLGRFREKGAACRWAVRVASAGKRSRSAMRVSSFARRRSYTTHRAHGWL
jgi:hypothetical protein